MNETPKGRGRIQFLLIAAIFLGPLAIAAWMYFSGSTLIPEGRTNHGALLQPIVHLPDATALDPRAEHFDPRASIDNPIWFLVDVRALQPLPQPLTRDDLRQHPALAGMELLRKGSRLSVQPVRAVEWRVVLKLAGVADPLQET